MTLSQIYNLDSGFDAREKINTSFEVVDILWGLTNSSSSSGSTSSVYSVNGMTGSIVLTTDEISEGSNLYFTESRVLSTTLTGFLSSSGTISSTDTILEAIQKLDGNIPDVSITSNTIPKGNGTSIVDGTWQFTSNDIIPITTGSNIGNSSSRIGTIFISNNTPNIDYYGDLTFHNGTSTKMTLNGNGDLGLGLNAFPYRFAAISNDNADFSAVKLLSANQAQFLELGWAGLNSTYYLKLTSGSSQDIILTPSGGTYIKGSSSISPGYALKIENSSFASIANFRNDQFVGIGTSAEVIGNTGHKFEMHGVSNNGLGTDCFYNAAFSTTNAFAVDMGAGITFGGKYNTAGNINPFSGINGVKLNSTDGDFQGRLNLWVRNGSTAVVSFTSTPYGSKVRNGIGIKNPTALLHLDGDNADVFISQARCITTDGYAGKFFANSVNPANTNIGIYSEVANGLNNYSAILMGGAVGIGIVTPTAGTRLHVYRAINDFLYEAKIENPTNGVSAAAAILIQSDSGKLEFGQLSTLHTTYSGYGQLSDTFIRSGTGSRNMNFITDPANVGKILFFSRLSPTIDASTPSLAIDGLKVGIGTNVMTSNLQVVGLVEYADNAAATGAGLTVGAFYRTGDLLKVVH